MQFTFKRIFHAKFGRRLTNDTCNLVCQCRNNSLVRSNQTNGPVNSQRHNVNLIVYQIHFINVSWYRVHCGTIHITYPPRPSRPFWVKKVRIH